MRTMLAVTVLALLTGLPAGAGAGEPTLPNLGTARAGHKGSKGLGLGIGGPTSLTFKYFAAGDLALDVALDLGHFHSGLGIHADALWHPFLLAQEPGFSLPVYVGVGLAIASWHDNAVYWNGRRLVSYGSTGADLGLRVPFGIAFWLRKLPLEFYLEFGPDIWLVDLNAGLFATLGFRFYF